MWAYPKIIIKTKFILHIGYKGVQEYKQWKVGHMGKEWYMAKSDGNISFLLIEDF